MKVKLLLILGFVLTIFVIDTQQATAQVPRNLTIQGVLTDSTSHPIQDGIHTITLRLYDKLLGGNLLHSEEFVIPIKKGLFNLTLGTNTQLPSTLIFDRQCFVGISYDGNSEIARIPLTSVPYSLMAESVPDGSITTEKIADGSITLEKLSVDLRNEKKSSIGLSNFATGPFSFIGGGDNNYATGSFSAVTGGFTNKAQANYAVAAGGFTNTANALYSTVSGGAANISSGVSSFIGGGSSNKSASNYSTIGAGLQNIASGNYSSILGGYSNTASGNYSTIPGGLSNTVSGAYGIISGGQSNSVASQYASILGGYSNNISSSSNGAVITGGNDNSISSNSQYSFIGGGNANNETAQYTVIGGGSTNDVTGNYASILGGKSNSSSGLYSFVGGGLNNTASGSYAVVSGGNENNASGSNSTVNGGYKNSSSGDFATIVGGTNNTVGSVGGVGIGSNILIGNSANGAIVIGNGGSVSARLTSNIANSLSVGFGSSTPTFFVEKVQGSSGFGRVGFGNISPSSLIDISGAITIRGMGVPAVSPAGQGRIYFDNITGKFKGSENGGPYVDLIGESGGGGGAGWQLTGNAGIVEGTNFLGPINNVYLDLRAGNGQQGSTTRLRLNINGSIQRNNGGDTRGSEAIDLQTFRDDPNQVASGLNSVITGNQSNEASGDLTVIGGGDNNLAQGVLNSIGGGTNNRADGFLNSIGNGAGNFTAFDVSFSSILGGNGNEINGREAGAILSAILGGQNNIINGNNSIVIGGVGLNFSGSNAIGYHANHFNLDVDAYDRDMIVSASNTAVLGNVDLWLANNDNTPRSLRFYEQHDASGNFPGGANYVALKAPNTIATDVTWTLPNSDGASGEVLTTSGTGTLSWSAPSIPCGGIIMWTGDINNVPSGWVLCDGNNGTPNLNNQFPRGTTSAVNVGVSGGSDSHSHTVADHNHTVSLSGSGTGSSSTDPSSGFVTLNVNTTSIPDGNGDNGTTEVVTDVTVNSDDHSHGINNSVSVNVSGTTDNAGTLNTDSASNVPAFVYVGFIMRVCN